MQTEIEAKFINADHDRLRSLLKSGGGTLEQAECLMRRRVYDYPDGRLYRDHAWARVRDEGDKITMSFKQNRDDSLHGTVEVNLVVDDFESAHQFLTALGLRQKAYQETRRESWLLDGVEVALDTWPWLPPFVELEGPSEAAVRAVAARLGLDWPTAMHGSVAAVYQRYYEVTADEVNAWAAIDFRPVPDWLAGRRRSAGG